MTAKPRKEVAVTVEAMAQALAVADDFGHEMRVRSALEQCGAKGGAKVQHGWTYLDPIEERPRQFDLRCAIKHHEFARYLQMAIECKNLALEAPLIISGTRRTDEEAFHDYVYSEPRSGRTIVGVNRCRIENSFYDRGGFVGKSIVRLKPNREEGILVQASALESEIYNRWAQALASADELCKNAALASEGGPLMTCTFILPAVVVPDGTLWTVQYNNVGSFGSGPVPSTYATMFVNHEVVVAPNTCWMNLSHIHFFTLTGLRKFLADLLRPKNTWEEWFPASAEAHRPRVH